MNTLLNIFKAKPSTSVSNSLDKVDVQKLVRDALLVGASAVLSYVIANLATVETTSATAILIPFINMGLTAVLKYVKDNSIQK